jgi:tetratricopeptide (TPR) repeat protein
LHQLIADRLIEDGHPSWAADHLELAAFASLDLDPEDRSVPERAADALVEAGDRARGRMESRTATDDYRRALALAGPRDRWGVREARALAGKGESHYWLAEYPAATEVLEQAASLGSAQDDPFALALALRFLGDIAINVDADLDRAEELFDRSLEAAERLGDPWAIVRTLLFAGWVPWTRHWYDDAEAIWRRALDLADPEDGWARVRALNSLSINRTGGPGETVTNSEDLHREALRLSDEASALADQIGDQFSIAITTVQRARVLEELGRVEDSLPCFDDAIAIFQDLGARWELGDATAERGIVKRELGRLEEAEEDLQSAIRISEELGERQLASWTWRALARVSERRGDQTQAEERYRRSEEAEERFRRSRGPDPEP